MGRGPKFYISSQLPSVPESVDWPLWGLTSLFFCFSHLFLLLLCALAVFPFPRLAFMCVLCSVAKLYLTLLNYLFQALSHVPVFMIAWNEACQSSLPFTISWSLLKFMSIELVMLSNYLILCCPFFPFAFNLSQHQSFPMSWLFALGGQNIGVSASASVLPMNIQGWFPSELTRLISLSSKGLSTVFPNTTIHKHQFFGAQPSLWSNSHIHTWLLEKTIALTIWTLVSKVMSLLFNTLSRFVIAFFQGASIFLIPRLLSPSAVILEHKKTTSVTVSTVSPSVLP